MTNEIIVLLGHKGSGKTYLSRKIIERKDSYIIYDPVRNFSGSGTIIEDPQSAIEYLKKKPQGFKIVYQPDSSSLEKDVFLSEFKKICYIVHCLSNTYFLVDEIDTYVKPTSCPHYFNNLIQRGRHLGISLIVTTRRPQETTRHLTAQSDILISFNQHEPSDIKYLGTFFREKAQELRSLPPYHYIKFERGEVSVNQPI